MSETLEKAKALAAEIDGIEYDCKFSGRMYSYEEKAREQGLVIVYGESDDLMEFGGATGEELAAFGGRTVSLAPDGIYTAPHGCDSEDPTCAHHQQRLAECREIKAVWGKDDYSWAYETDIPHSEFDVVEGEEKYCRGIVFHVSELKRDVEADRADLDEPRARLEAAEADRDALAYTLGEVSDGPCRVYQWACTLGNPECLADTHPYGPHHLVTRECWLAWAASKREEAKC